MTGNTFRYLPVSVGEQTYGIPFGSIKQVLKWSALSAAQAGAPPAENQPPADEVTTINLTRLFTGKTHVGEHSHVIVVDAQGQALALVVDRVAPVRDAEASSYFAMPAVFSTPDNLFGAAVRDENHLVMIIEPSRFHLSPHAAGSQS